MVNDLKVSYYKGGHERICAMQLDNMGDCQLKLNWFISKCIIIPLST